MDDIIDKVVAESNDNDLEEIVKVATQLVGGHDSQDNKQLTGGDETQTHRYKKMQYSSTTGQQSSEEDNMDYDSDDDDDSKSNNSSSNNRNNNKKRLKGEVKRSHHNVLERKRRDLIKDSFTKLKEAVPTLSIDRASRAQILKKAADFIQAQHQRNESTKADIKDLIKKNADLESKINNRIQVKEEQE